jgi:predicted acetyltransferase
MPFSRYLEVLAEQERGENLPPKHVPSTFLFAFVATRIIGRVSIHHSLNEFLERVGGHIGYVVVPEFRRQGYATTILRLSLQIAREKLGIRRVLLTCDDNNIGFDQNNRKEWWHPRKCHHRAGPRQTKAPLLD